MPKSENFLQRNWATILSFVLGLIIFGISTYASTAAQGYRDGAIGLVISLLITTIYRIDKYQKVIEDEKTAIGTFIYLLQKKSGIDDIVAHFHKAFSKVCESTTPSNQFYKFFFDKTVNNLISQLYSISEGQYNCDAETELNLTKDILRCCNKSLKAVSYQDEKWWTSNNGLLYLNAHSKHISHPNERAVRVFIIESASAPHLKSIFKSHQLLNIETYVLYSDIDNIDNKYKIDFVIYDDFMVRRASEIKNNEGGKDAHFTSNKMEVAEYLEKFDQLLAIAKNKKNPLPK